MPRRGLGAAFAFLIALVLFSIAFYYVGKMNTSSTVKNVAYGIIGFCAILVQGIIVWWYLSGQSANSDRKYNRNLDNSSFNTYSLNGNNSKLSPLQQRINANRMNQARAYAQAPNAIKNQRGPRYIGTRR